jgi:hypothetical protein
MGCDWIDPAGAAVGFKLAFDVVFKGTKFDDRETIYTADDYYEQEKGSNDSDEEEDEDDKEEMNRESPHTFLTKEWSEFISSKHAGLVDENFTTFIGARSMPGVYEKQMYTNHCVVVFGYDMDLDVKEVNGVMEMHPSPVFSFPNGIKEAIMEFVEVHMKEKAIKKCKHNEVKIDDQPKIVYFVC